MHPTIEESQLSEGISSYSSLVVSLVLPRHQWLDSQGPLSIKYIYIFFNLSSFLLLVLLPLILLSLSILFTSLLRSSMFYLTNLSTNSQAVSDTLILFLQMDKNLDLSVLKMSTSPPKNRNTIFFMLFLMLSR